MARRPADPDEAVRPTSDIDPMEALEALPGADIAVLETLSKLADVPLAVGVGAVPMELLISRPRVRVPFGLRYFSEAHSYNTAGSLILNRTLT